jgi:phosphoglycolate phosphatase-like HAD superfamily hydrolase
LFAEKLARNLVPAAFAQQCEMRNWRHDYQDCGIRLGHTLIDDRKDGNVPLESRPVYLMPEVDEVLPSVSLSMAVWANTRTATKRSFAYDLERAGIGRFFTWIVTSVDAGFRKPLPEFFDFALTKCRLARMSLFAAPISSFRRRANSHEAR